MLSLEHGTLTHFRRLDVVKSRILSIAWGPPIPKQSTRNTANGGGKSDEEDSDEDEEDEWKDSWIVAGCSDSSLRKWDVASGRVTDRMGTDKMRGERTLVWAVETLGRVFYKPILVMWALIYVLGMARLYPGTH